MDKEQVRNHAHFDGKISDTKRHLEIGGAYFGLIGEISRLIGDKQRIFLGASDFSTGEGIAKATKLQGEILGLEAVIDMIFLAAEREETDG